MKQLWRSPTLRSMVVYGAAGAGFAGANLILARVLPKDEYGLFTLVIALMNLGYSLAPTGVDGIVNRRHLEAGPSLLRRVVLASSSVAVIFAAIGLFAYDLSPMLALLLFISTAAGGALLVAGAKFQSEHRFAISLTLIQSPNIVLLFAALAVFVLHTTSAWPAILISSAGLVIAAIFGWSVLFRERHGKPQRESGFAWKEALSFAGLEVAGLTLVQLERLVIPHVLPMTEMATFGVLAAIVGSLFRVMQMGVGYTLLPRLRASTTVVQRRKLIAHEAQAGRPHHGARLRPSSALRRRSSSRTFLRGKYHLPAS